MTDKMYDRAKYTAQIVMPAVTAFYLALGEIWGFPYQVQMAASFAALNVLLGSIVAYRSVKYNKAQPGPLGVIRMEDDEEDDSVAVKLDLHEDLTALSDGQKAYFRVSRPGSDQSTQSA